MMIGFRAGDGRAEAIVGPIVIQNVHIEGLGTVTLRIKDEAGDEDAEQRIPYDYVAEYRVVCGAQEGIDRNYLNTQDVEGCGTENWILVGSDPADYRCEKCTAWL